MKYGDKRDYHKIDLFVAHTVHGRRYYTYAASTTWAKTCKEARQRYYENNYPKIALANIKATKSR